MANHKSSLKRIRANDAKADRNKYQLKTTRTFIKRLKNTTVKKDAEVLLKEVTSMIDKLAKKNIIHRNNAAHKVSKLTKLVTGLGADKAVTPAKATTKKVTAAK
ncbi:MAG TPA: 30S ribosomal protein S20 [Cytophagaceae bacterium]|nr:30S ribosomal protein S20 [Cytophagaceae bacterium]